LTVPRYDN